MLKQRVITALVLVTVLLAAMLAEQSLYWQVFINLAVLVGFWEWLRFCKLSSVPMQALAYLGFAGVSSVLQLGVIPMPLVVPIACLLWLILFVFTMSNSLDFLHHRLLKVLIGMVILPVAALIVIELKDLTHGPLWILCFMVAVWAADIGAYFVGRRFGKTKLAPQVSPGKTVEGLLGGLAFAMVLYAPVLFHWFALQPAVLLLATILVTVLVSVMGDLFESKLKRFAGIKDSSQILPGHGGLLDRIDSLLSSAPFFAMGLIILGYW
ncbi:MAG: phosphatidate cytidylyltransferase [Gammaproteobacteria bacterium]|nr:phosphatidate cytidylyltransferase [Gammaproteobacteria bacterium]